MEEQKSRGRRWRVHSGTLLTDGPTWKRKQLRVRWERGDSGGNLTQAQTERDMGVREGERERKKETESSFRAAYDDF